MTPPRPCRRANPVNQKRPVDSFARSLSPESSSSGSSNPHLLLGECAARLSPWRPSCNYRTAVAVPGCPSHWSSDFSFADPHYRQLRGVLSDALPGANASKSSPRSSMPTLGYRPPPQQQHPGCAASGLDDLCCGSVSALPAA